MVVQGGPIPSLASPGGRGEPYMLRRPNVFVGTASDGVLQAGDKLLAINNQSTDELTHIEVQEIFRNSGTSAELEVARRDDTDMLSGRQGADVAQARHLLTSTLTPLVTPSLPPLGRGAPRLPTSRLHTPDPPHTDNVPIDDQPYRTLPLVLPHAKTIHDTLPPATFLPHHAETLVVGQPYRSSVVALPAPRTLNDLSPGSRGAPTYQQYRGPQFNTQMARPPQKAGLPAAYNSPAPLYSQENLDEVATNHQGYVQAAPKPTLPSLHSATLSKPHDSDTFRMILESEMDAARSHEGVGGRSFDRQLSGQERPGSQQSDRSSDAGGVRPPLDPVMKNNSINQSASFKKVMYSVMGETEF